MDSEIYSGMLNKIVFILLITLCFSTLLVGQDTTQTADSSQIISVSIEDLKQRAKDAAKGITYSFRSKEEETQYYQYVNSRIFDLEKELEVKSREIDTLKVAIAKFLSEKEEQKKNEKAGWRKMKKYMSMAKVKKILGSPTAITKYSASTKYWYGNGFVEFNAFKAVSSWAEPRKNRTEVIEH